GDADRKGARRQGSRARAVDRRQRVDGRAGAVPGARPHLLRGRGAAADHAVPALRARWEGTAALRARSRGPAATGRAAATSAPAPARELVRPDGSARRAAVVLGTRPRL